MTETKKITRKQAWNQIDHIGRSLILYILLFMTFQYGTDLLFDRFPQIISVHSADTIRLAGSLVLTLFLLLVPFQISARALKLKIRDYLQDPGLGFFNLLSLCCIGIAIQLTALVAASLLGIFSGYTEDAAVFLGSFNSREYIIANALYFLQYVLVKPICDEFIFRGIIQRQLGHYGRYFGVLSSALLYAVAQPDPRMAIPAFALGWYLSVLTLRTHSIRPAIAIHITAELLFWLLEIIPSRLLFLQIPVLLVIYVTAFIRILSRRGTGSPARIGATDARLWKIFFTTPTIIICFFLFAANIILTILT